MRVTPIEPALRPKRGPYADAPRLPEGSTPEGEVDLRSIVSGAWIELEIGPGPRAGFLLERAVSAPEAALMGIEIRRKWATVGDEKLAKIGAAARARVFCDDAGRALPRLRPSGAVRRVYLHFPDPWWKKRHQKRLVMRDELIVQIVRLLERGGELFIQTDVEERAALYADVVGRCEELVAAPVSDDAFGARSPREHRAIADGLPIYRMLWKRR